MDIITHYLIVDIQREKWISSSEAFRRINIDRYITSIGQLHLLLPINYLTNSVAAFKAPLLLFRQIKSVDEFSSSCAFFIWRSLSLCANTWRQISQEVTFSSNAVLLLSLKDPFCLVNAESSFRWEDMLGNRHNTSVKTRLKLSPKLYRQKFRTALALPWLREKLLLIFKKSWYIFSSPVVLFTNSWWIIAFSCRLRRSKSSG